MVGWSCLFAFAIMLVLKGKPYYIGPIYPVLYGAGAVVLERVRWPRWGGIVRWGTVAAVIGYAALLLPLGLPILPPESMERYAIRLGIQRAIETNVGDVERLPQDYADMLNWDEQVREIARVFNTLAPAERATAVILASNYGEAGAIDFYGPRYGLPKALAFAGTYWFFGPGQLPGEVIILHGFTPDDFDGYCGSIETAGSVTHPFAVSEERNLAVYVCREPRQTMQELWPSLEGEQ